MIAPSAERSTTLGEALAQRVRHPLRRAGKQPFAALSDVSFDLASGEAIGIIGRNGAGKSTLLKILSRVTAPSAGEIDLYGRVGSLLEVGTGFHPELTGRENVFMNGAILGMTKRAIRAQFDSIVEFAEIGPFLDTPVKRYSSGMYVRLAFAVAAHLEPEILVVDEVLAVGDVQFQRKCLGKMSDVAGQDGRGVLFVSHNMAAVESLCSRAVVLEGGRVVFDGRARDGIQRYLASAREGDQLATGLFELAAEADDEHHIKRLRVCDTAGELTDGIPMGEGLKLVIDIDRFQPLTQMMTVRIKTDEELVVAGAHSQLRSLDLVDSGSTANQITVDVPPLPIHPGKYWIELAFSEGRKGNSVIETVDRAASIEILATDYYGSGWQTARGARYGIVALDPVWTMAEGTRVVAHSRPRDGAEG